MGTRYVLHFENDTFMDSVNLAKWNIYSVALQDLTLFTFSKLKANFNYQDTEKAKEIFLKILDDETSNKMPIEKTNQIANVIISKPLDFSQCCSCFDIYTSLFLVITGENHNHYEIDLKC